jgi:long-chain fatty acid transport protein
MDGMKRATLLVTAVLLASAGTAFASGFNIYEAGARATALGGAFTATADDASALYYNAAGIAFLEGTVLDLNVMPILPSSKFTGGTPPFPAAEGETTDQVFPIPGAYVTHNTGHKLAFGIGVAAPFGLGVQWKDSQTWVGRRSSYDVKLANIYVMPAAALRLNDRVALAVGADVGWCRIKLKRFTAIEFGPTSQLIDVIDSKLEGDSDLNVTPQFGFLAHLNDELSFGFMFHMQKTLKFVDQDATLSNVAPNISTLRSNVDAQIAASGGTEQKVSTDLRLPGFFSLGVAYQIHEHARLEFDAVRFGWSHFDKLALDFASPTNPDQTIEEQYKDIWQLRFGLDVDVSPQVKAMFGYVHDNTPQPVKSISPLLPDADREDFSLGLQWRKDRMRLTACYMAVLFHDRTNVVDGVIERFDTSQPDGRYDSHADIFGLGVGYDF